MDRAKHNRITAARLVRNLENATVPLRGFTASNTQRLPLRELGYYELVKLGTTVKHIRSLLASCDEEASSWASTSRQGAVQAGSIQDLQKRLASAELVLSQEMAKLPKRPTTSTPTYDFDFLAPGIPTMPTLPVLSVPPPPVIEEIFTEEKDLLMKEEVEFGSSELEAKEVIVSTSPIMTPSTLPPSPSVLRSRNTPSANESEKTSTLSTPLTSASTSTSPLLEHHHSLQSHLLTSLTSMSSQLKSNSLALSSSLAKDKLVMEDAQEKLQGNLGRMKKEGGRLGGYSKKSGGTTCMILGLVGAVAILWIAMFLLIKVT